MEIVKEFFMGILSMLQYRETFWVLLYMFAQILVTFVLNIAMVEEKLYSIVRISITIIFYIAALVSSCDGVVLVKDIYWPRILANTIVITIFLIVCLKKAYDFGQED